MKLSGQALTRLRTASGGGGKSYLWVAFFTPPATDSMVLSGTHQSNRCAIVAGLRYSRCGNMPSQKQRGLIMLQRHVTREQCLLKCICHLLLPRSEHISGQFCGRPDQSTALVPHRHRLLEASDSHGCLPHLAHVLVPGIALRLIPQTSQPPVDLGLALQGC